MSALSILKCQNSAPRFLVCQAKKYALSTRSYVRMGSIVNRFGIMSLTTQKFITPVSNPALSMARSIHSSIILNQESTSDQTQSQSDRTIFVAGLGTEFTNEQLLEAARKYGEVEEAHLSINPKFGTSRGYGFVTFAKVEDANTAISSLNSTEVEGRVVYVSKSTSKPKKESAPSTPSTTLYINNLPEDVTKDDLKDIFKAYGVVSDVRAPQFAYSGKSRGFGFVTLESIEIARSALEVLKGSDFRGKALDIQYANSKPSKSSQ